MRRDAWLWPVLGAILLVVAVLVFAPEGPILGLDRADAAQFAALSILGTVIAGGLLSSRRAGLGQAARALLIWGAGFALLIGLYAYRDSFEEVRQRWLAELLPGRTIALAGSQGREVAVRRAADGHFHVGAEIDGRSVPFLVDSGASLVALDRATAGRLGFDVAALAFDARVQTANGTARAAFVTLERVAVGGIVRRDVRAAIMDAGGDGLNLLGMSFLGTLSSLEFRGPQLVMRD